MSAPDSKCPECGSGLLAAKSQDKGKKTLVIAAAALALLLGSGGYVFTQVFGDKAPPVTVATSGSTALPPAPPPPPQVGAKTLLRFSGSNTIGSALAPRMAEAWLVSLGATGVGIYQREKDGQKIPETVVQAKLNNEPIEIEIRAHGSGDAFKHLADGSADIGMSSRRVKPDESAALGSLGNMLSRDNEHVIALDGIAVIVAPGNGVPSLTRQNLGKIFSGEITDWSQVGGASGPIKLYARDDKSGTFDTFKSLVLGSNKLAAQAVRIEDSAELEAAVAADASGIGFVGLPYVKSAKALPISDGKALALAPTVFTVKKEDYALARRLYYYTAANPANAMVRKFIGFAQSDAGQQVVKTIGFVGQNIVEAEARTLSQANRRSCPLGPQWPGAKDAYCRLIADKSDLGTNFRFQSGSSELDNKAAQDLQRVLQLMSDKQELKLTLVGFADGQGPYAQNVKLSEDRATAVRQALRTLGITSVETQGFGQEIPVGDNGTEDGRERNRRVEVWFK